MQLIGMLDSPYVRRVAISLHMLGVPFEHRPLSVFRDYDAFAAINPVVKAPTLVTDEGVVLLDSTLILDHAEMVAGASLMPGSGPERTQALRLLGLALGACEKAVQIVYERRWRPEEKQHAAWLERVAGQLRGALAEIEREILDPGRALVGGQMRQPDVTTAVMFSFTQLVVSDVVDVRHYPKLAAFTAGMEADEAFQAFKPEGLFPQPARP